MNWECFIIISLIRASSKYSTWSSFIDNVIHVPRVKPILEGVIVNEPPASELHVYSISSLCLLVTTTLFATKNAE